MLNLFGLSLSDDKLNEYLADKALLVDVREDYEFASGSVPGAVNIPLSKLSNNVSFFKNRDKIILFCRSGNRSGQALSVLQNLGIKNIINGGSVSDVIAAQNKINK